jgi:outer membrane protein
MRHGRLIALALFAYSAGAANAQQTAGTLTLTEAQRIAREHNPAFQRTANDLESAESSIRSAWGAFLPSLSTSMSFSAGGSTAVTGQDDFGRPVELPEPRSFKSSSANQGISTGLTLFDGGATWRNLQAQRVLYEGTDAAIAGAGLQLDAQVAREYYQTLRAVNNIALEEQLLASARDRLTRTEELLRLAARNRGDVLGAREDVLLAEQNVARAKSEADRARIVLATTLGLDANAPITLDTVMPAAFDPANLNIDQLVSRAVTANPAVRQRESAARAAHLRRQAAGARRLPRISASAGYSRSMGLSSYRAFGELNPQNSGYSFGVSVSLPLFSQFSTVDAISQASAAALDAEHDLRGARLAAERDVRSAAIELSNAYQSLQLAEQRAGLARERQELALEQYRLGAIDFTSLQNIIDRTAGAERAALDARFGFITARVNLEERLGSRLEG